MCQSPTSVSVSEVRSSIPSRVDPDTGDLLRHGPTLAERELYLHLTRAQVLSRQLADEHEGDCRCYDCPCAEYSHLDHLLTRAIVEPMENALGSLPTVDEATGLPLVPVAGFPAPPLPEGARAEEEELRRLLKRVAELLASIHGRHEAGCADGGCAHDELPHWRFFVGRLVVDLESRLLEGQDGPAALVVAGREV